MPTPEKPIPPDPLLLTWHIIAIRKRIEIPLDPFELKKADDTRHLAERCESEYGDGHYIERKQMFEDSLNRLRTDGRVDIHHIHEILKTAKQQMFNDLREGRIADYRRLVSDTNRSLKNLQKWANRTRKLYEQLYRSYKPISFDAPEHFQALETPNVTGLVASINNLLEALKRNPLKALRVRGQIRRPRQRRPPQPWLDEARRKLSRARVPEDLRESLLMAVGLTRYRDT